MEVDLVVSHFNEDLRWLKRVPEAFKITVYAKGSPPDFRFLSRPVTCRHLPNIGREAHTWLLHCLEHWQAPAEVTVFLQGHPFDHCHDTHARLKQVAEEGSGSLPASGFHWWGFIIETDDAMGERVFVPWSKNCNHRKLDIGARYRALFEATPPCEYRFFPGGQFAVSRSALQFRPPEFYRKAIALFDSDPDLPYCLERFWDVVFNAPSISDETMGGEKTVYLKKIRKLERFRMMF